jgi:uncharacterized protein
LGHSAGKIVDAVLSIPSEETIKQILEEARTIAVIGWSDREERPSHGVAGYLHRRGYDVALVNPRLAGKPGPWGEQVYAEVGDIARKVNIVDLFRRAGATPMHAEQAVAVGADVLWLQLGIINDEAGEIARAGGLTFIQDRCIQIEHLRLIRHVGGSKTHSRE